MPSLASYAAMMQRDREREGLRVCRAAWLVGVSVRDYREIEAGERDPDCLTWESKPSDGHGDKVARVSHSIRKERGMKAFLAALVVVSVFALPASADSHQVIFGTPGADIIRDAPTSDTIYGRGGDDRIAGIMGWDEIHGGRGNDSLWGGLGRDTLYGGPGDDRLHNWNAVEGLLDGGRGYDVCVVNVHENVTVRNCEVVKVHEVG
jgi:RTX calcium-binding nonapeptide repeat (4 copies)